MIFVIVAIVAIAALIHYYVTRQYKFFDGKGIKPIILTNPYVESANLLLSRGDMVEEFLNYYRAEPTKRVTAAFVFKLPTVILRDPELIQQVAIKDFDHYTDHVDAFFKEEIDPFFGKSLFALKGKRWHEMRSTLSPAFTGSKMRGMFELMSVCGDQLVAYFNNQYALQGDKKPLEIEFKETTTRFTNDMIATTAFGIKINSFADKDNEFYKIGRQLSNFSNWRFLLLMMCPKICQITGMRVMSPAIYEFFTRLMNETIEARLKHNIVRPDMVHLMLEARKELEKKNNNDEGTENNKSQCKMSDEDITAQSFLFFFAGFETVSIAMCFSIYELCINPDIQRKLQKEIDEAKESCNGKITYDAVMKMKYLDMVVSETLRKWPPVAAIDRQCTKEHTINADGNTIKISPGMGIQFPIMGIHRDEKYYENPEKYDPERFNDDNKGSIKPGTYIPFGYGPRICIASRFALLETKVLLYSLLGSFDFEVIEKTPIPLVLRKGASNLDAQGGFWVGLKPRNLKV